MPEPAGKYLVDAHLDIAYHCLEHGRELADPGEAECMVTLPWLQTVNTRVVCATLFTEPRHSDAIRHYQLHSQYEMYQQWFAEYPDSLWSIRNQADLQQLAQVEPTVVNGGVSAPIGVILLMEGCDLLASPAEAQTWWERGVRMAGITWNGKNKYACGCFADGGGITPLGKGLLAEFAHLGMILDLSHLAEQGIGEALGLYTGAVCSSHSNARAVCGNERNLIDTHALAIARRSGVIGLNLLAPLLIQGWRKGDAQPPIAAATQHTAYLAKLCGSDHVGIGSDLDGGLTVANTPQGIERIDHLLLLVDDLRTRGWKDDMVAGFMGRNWWRFFEQALPE